MSDADVERGKLHFMQTVGMLPEAQRALIEYAPGFFAGYARAREWIYEEKGPGHLDRAMKELIYVVLDVVNGSLEGAKIHAEAGLNAGLTSCQIAEACMQTIMVCGITTWGKTGAKLVEYVVELEQQKKRSETTVP